MLTSYNLHPHTLSVYSVNDNEAYVQPWPRWAFPEQVGISIESLTYSATLPGLLGAEGKDTIILSNDTA